MRSTNSKRMLALGMLLAVIPIALAETSKATPQRRAQPKVDRFPIHAVEQAYEVSASSVTLPDGAASFLLVQPCASCSTQSLSIDAHSQFLLDGKSLTFIELRKRLLGNSVWTATALYAAGEMRLTRFLVSSR